MSDITVTAANVGRARPHDDLVRSYVAAVAITKGQAVYINTAGKVALADANGSGTLQFRGIALHTVGAGGTTDVLHDGDVYGFGVSGLNADALVYLSNTAGALATAAGSTSVAAGRVVCLTDGPTMTKVLRIFTRWSADWS